MMMWDNRSLLRKANGDYDMNQVRYICRVMRGEARRSDIDDRERTDPCPRRGAKTGG
jgi:hypothetical protein